MDKAPGDKTETPVPVSSTSKEQIPEKAAPFKEEDQDDDFEFMDLNLSLSAVRRFGQAGVRRKGCAAHT